MLDGKCKEAFEKYLHSKDIYEYIDLEGEFEDIPFSMQWGVYLEFFDSVDIKIDTTYMTKWYSCDITINDKFPVTLCDNHWTRQQAQTESIKKATEIFNDERRVTKDT